MEALWGPEYLPVPTHSYQFQLLFSDSWGASVLGAQIVFLRMPLNDPCFIPTLRIVKSIQGLWMCLDAPQFPPSTDILNNLEENVSSQALVAEAMTLSFLDPFFVNSSMEGYPTAPCLGRLHYRKPANIQERRETWIKLLGLSDMEANQILRLPRDHRDEKGLKKINT